NNGDAATDMILKAHEYAVKQTGQATDKDRRIVPIHTQFARPDQLAAFKKYNMVPSFFTNHAYFWGDVHIKNLGEKRANSLSPLATVDKMGIPYTNHSDDTVTPVDPLFSVWTAVNRTSRTGQVIGTDERITPYQALKAITSNAAYQYFEEDTKGTLAPGKLADLVILDNNPLTIKPADIRNIKVVKTIKEGNTIYQRPVQ
ncbi:amidohydrolase, partial [Psychrobacter celer]